MEKNRDKAHGESDRERTESSDSLNSDNISRHDVHVTKRVEDGTVEREGERERGV